MDNQMQECFSLDGPGVPGLLHLLQSYSFEHYQFAMWVFEHPNPLQPMLFGRSWLLEQLNKRFPSFKATSLPKVLNDFEEAKFLEIVEHSNFRRKTASKYKLAGPLAALYISYKWPKEQA